MDGLAGAGGRRQRGRGRGGLRRRGGRAGAAAARARASAGARARARWAAARAGAAPAGAASAALGASPRARACGRRPARAVAGARQRRAGRAGSPARPDAEASQLRIAETRMKRRSACSAGIAGLVAGLGRRRRPSPNFSLNSTSIVSSSPRTPRSRFEIAGARSNGPVTTRVGLGLDRRRRRRAAGGASARASAACASRNDAQVVEEARARAATAVASCGRAVAQLRGQRPGRRRRRGAARPASCAPARAVAGSRRRPGVERAASRRPSRSSVAASASIERAELAPARRGLAGHRLGVGDQAAQRGVLAVDLGERAVGRDQPGPQLERGAVEVVAAPVERRAPARCSISWMPVRSDGPNALSRSSKRGATSVRGQRLGGARPSQRDRRAAVDLAQRLAAPCRARRRRSCRRSCPAGGSPRWRRRAARSIVLVEQQRDLGEAVVGDLDRARPSRRSRRRRARSSPRSSGKASSNSATTCARVRRRAARTGRGTPASARAAAP